MNYRNSSSPYSSSSSEYDVSLDSSSSSSGLNHRFFCETCSLPLSTSQMLLDHWNSKIHDHHSSCCSNFPVDFVVGFFILDVIVQIG